MSLIFAEVDCCYDTIEVTVCNDGDITVSINDWSVILKRKQAEKLVMALTRAGYGTSPLSPVSTTFWLGADA